MTCDKYSSYRDGMRERVLDVTGSDVEATSPSQPRPGVTLTPSVELESTVKTEKKWKQT